MCASHSGRPEHVERAARLLARGGFQVEALLCGVHAPFDDEAAADLRARGLEPNALHNNCSGKHAGMLLACALYGFTTGDYISPQHPLQRAALEEVGRFCRQDLIGIGVGVDGCSAPAFRLPLECVARGFAALVDPRSAGIPEREAAAAGRVVEAMTTAPEMVAGPRRFTTALMQATRGRVLGKEGAEGFYAAAVRSPRPLGIAIKIADGGERCRDGVVVEVLRQLGALEEAELAALAPYQRAAVRNHRAFFVGEIEPQVRLAFEDPA
jgi:L-asparaginase II